MKSLISGARFPVAQFGLLLTVLLLCGCETPPVYSFQDPGSGGSTNATTVGGGSNTPQPAPDGAPLLAQSADLLHPGNRLTITFSGTPLPPPKHEEKIREDGTITPPQLDKPVQAAGLTVGELQDALHKAYVPAYYKSLTVTVAAEERFFYVAGEVKTPGRLLYLSRMTVLRAVQAAGDFTDFASRKNVEVIRANGKVERVNCIKAGKDPRLDKPIYPDDTVRVRRRLM